jgi:hypothetical protein
MNIFRDLALRNAIIDVFSHRINAHIHFPRMRLYAACRFIATQCPATGFVELYFAWRTLELHQNNV